MDPSSYQRLVGKLIYLTHTRPDIAYTVGVLSQFMHTPCVSHLHAAHRVLRFLKWTIGRGLLFCRHSILDLEVYTDADYAGSVVDRRSISGYCTFLGDNLITWRNKKQKVVSRSSAKAEFRALAQGLCEALWITKILRELCCPVSSLYNYSVTTNRPSALLMIPFSMTAPNILKLIGILSKRSWN